MSLVSSKKTRFVDPQSLPPSPVYVFRGHVAEITAIQFIKTDTQFVSGHCILTHRADYSDTDGWIVGWDMASRRPNAVWHGHGASVLSIREWGTDKLITYPRPLPD
jgi:ASTRA-associated protein 1